jgi:hypothetical protein
MRADWNIAGVYTAPLAGHLVIALIVLLILRPLLARLRVADYFINAPVAEACLYVCILAVLVAVL